MRVRTLALMLWALPIAAAAAWQTVAVDQGKHVDIDRDTISGEPGGPLTARGRIVLDKPIVDPKTSAAYRTIEIESRFDCAERTHTTLRRTYYKEDGDLLRQEEIRSPFEMPVRSGTPDDRLLREVCRPKGSASPTPAGKALERIEEVSAGLRKSNDALVQEAARKDVQRLTQQANALLAGKGGQTGARRPSVPAEAAPPIAWAYEGAGGPEHWGRLRPEYATCASGRRQAPIDLRDGFAVDLDPIQFFYKPATYRVVDGGRHLQLSVYGGGLMLLGKHYQLTQIRFHHPSEFAVAGKRYDMEAQLIHRADDGKIAIVSILLERGSENPVLQAALNNLPLEKGGEVTPPGAAIDASALLPGDRRYFTFMGSLTVPPCSEDVLWMVFKQPQQVSGDQITMLQRLYRPNARPLQPALGRILKESR